MKKITYSEYFDRLYGCFLGKTISGTIGAPYEGCKMPMELPFRDEMVNTMLPNDDLDLQVLWLDVLENKGDRFTSRDLLERFCNYCSYSPGEYAVMRKNYNRGIYPPYSGILCNDYYKGGMGCPIRSEIWACVAPLNPALAAEFASRDGCIDHDSVNGESVIAEEYFAALESLAFSGDDVKSLVIRALDYIPKSKFSELVERVVEWCEHYGRIKLVLRKILFYYGHPDCTNMFQNMGITIASLLLGENDIIKTSMMALNCGFDTDCTCASAGSVIGILLGAKKILEAFHTDDIKYVLGVKSERRSDSVRDLCEDIAEIGVKFTEEGYPNSELVIEGAVPSNRCFVREDIEWNIEYSALPSIIPGEDITVTLILKNNTGKEFSLNCECACPEGFTCGIGKTLGLKPGENRYDFPVELGSDVKTVMERNIFTLKLTGEYNTVISFGVAAAAPWKLTGPLWRTDPVSDTESLMKVKSYYDLLGASKYDGNYVDVVRHFHVNMEPDAHIDEDKLSDGVLFGDVTDGGEFEEHEVFIREDSFNISDLMPFAGANTCYLTRKLIAPKDMDTCIQIGHSQPYTLWLNGEIISEHLHTGVFTSENYHLEKVHLKAGVNYLKWRITRTNADTHMSIIFSKKATCAEHFVILGSERF